LVAGIASSSSSRTSASAPAPLTTVTCSTRRSSPRRSKTMLSPGWWESRRAGGRVRLLLGVARGRSSAQHSAGQPQ
jgi:hypothetical protein